MNETVLIVDDEDPIRRLLSQKLTREGYRCLTAGNADEAAGRLRTTPVDLVLLDVKMPGRTGVELLPEIRSLYPDTAVIMATAITDVNTAIQCMRAGAYDYLNKPFNLDEVVLSVERALEKSRLILENRGYQQHLEQKVEEQAGRIRTMYFNAIASLAKALEAKDKYTSGHSERVADMAVAVARHMGMLPEDVEQLRLAGLVHDIGKIGVEGQVLNKPDRLTEEELQHIRSHPEIGERILKPIVQDGGFLDVVRLHHERYDGGGYPAGLSGSQIPLGARILAVCDAYDAMTSERPYRGAMGVETAVAEIVRCKGSQFDPLVVSGFEKVRNGHGQSPRTQAAVGQGVVGNGESEDSRRCRDGEKENTGG